MIKLQFLGTNAGLPSKARNVSSLIIQMLCYPNECWMFDCGEATQHQLLRSSFNAGKVSKVFITHLHGDHIYGLPGMLSTRSFQGATSKLEIYGPKGIKKYIDTSLAVSNTYLHYPLSIIEVEEGVICKKEHFTFEAIKLEHGIECFGYRIVEKDQPGELLVEKLKLHNISPGPLYREIKDGKTVTLEDGSEINGKDFVGPSKKGKIIAVAGDTRLCDNTRILAQDATILVHEATFAQSEKQLAFEHFHSTSDQAAELAKLAKVRTLFLTHISSRYSHNPNQLLEEARLIFPNTYLASDLDTYMINDDCHVNVQTLNKTITEMKH